jgi:hypothetical protein
MFLLKFKPILCFSALFCTASWPSFPAAIQITGSNTICEVGNCASPGTLSPGDSIGATAYSFPYTFANTDTYFIGGSYSASGAAPTINFSATATYIGNSTGTASAFDTLSVDLFQFFKYNDNPDGTYDESATLSQANVAPGSYVTSQLFFDGQGIGLLGPLTTLGSQSYSMSAVLTGLSNPSEADFNYTFHIAAGSPAVPEPTDAGLLALGIAGIGSLTLCRGGRYYSRKTLKEQ